LKEEVLAKLKADHALSKDERSLALQIAQRHVENPVHLNYLAWNIAKRPGLNQESYGLALRQAEAAVRLDQKEGYYLNALAVAQYRMGLFAEAVSNLSNRPGLLAFLAMAQHRLGKKDEAQAAMNRLRELIKEPIYAQHPEDQAFLKEAEAVLKEPAGK
jgi:Flp pilus assembly protein TadD